MYTAPENERRTNWRVMDFEEPKKGPVVPLEDYTQSPVLSLKQAVRGLDSIIPDIQSKVAIVLKEAANRKNALALNESAAIMLYTLEWKAPEDSLYFILNKTLRSEEKRALDPWRGYLKLLITALERLPRVNDTVYRGTKNLHEKFRIGEIFAWRSFTSCTEVQATLESDQFCGKSGQRTMFFIKCSTGVSIMEYSYYPGESEVLLLPGTKLTVIGIANFGHGLRHIQLKEVTPKYPHRAPIIASQVSDKPNTVSLS